MGTILGTSHPASCLQMGKMRHRGARHMHPSLVFNGQHSLYGGRVGTGLFAPKPLFLWLNQSASRQEGLTVTAPEKMVWQEYSVRFWALLASQSLFCAEKMWTLIYMQHENRRVPNHLFTQSSELGQFLTLTDFPWLFCSPLRPRQLWGEPGPWSESNPGDRIRWTENTA